MSQKTSMAKCHHWFVPMFTYFMSKIIDDQQNPSELRVFWCCPDIMIFSALNVLCMMY